MSTGTSVDPRLRAILNEQLPGYEPELLTVLVDDESGLRVEIDGALVVELSAERGPRAAQRLSPTVEATLLRLLGGLLDVPVPIPVFQDDEQSVRAHRTSAGEPLVADALAPDQLRRLGRRLGGVLADLHGVDASDTGVNLPIAPGPDWYRTAAARSFATRDPGASDPARVAAAAQFLEQPAPNHPPHPSLCHLDLRPANILLDDRQTLAGILDWSRAAIGDPARDFGFVLLHLGEAALDAALDGYRRAGAVTDDDPDLKGRIGFHARCSAITDQDSSAAGSVSLA